MFEFEYFEYLNLNILKKEAFFSHSAPFNSVTYTTALIIRPTNIIILILYKGKQSGEVR